MTTHPESEREKGMQEVLHALSHTILMLSEEERKEIFDICEKWDFTVKELLEYRIRFFKKT